MGYTEKCYGCYESREVDEVSGLCYKCIMCKICKVNKKMFYLEICADCIVADVVADDEDE